MQAAIVSPFGPVRLLLRQMINSIDPGIDVIEASDTGMIAQVLQQKTPAIVFTSLPAQSDGGIHCIVRLKSDFPELIFVVMVRYDYPEYRMMSGDLGIDEVVFEENMNRQCIQRIVDMAKARC